MESLESEIQSIDIRLPILEAEKRLAASKRDFKGAGKASREIKEATARRDQCVEEMNGDAQQRVLSAKKELEELEMELEHTKTIAYEKEKEKGIQTMIHLAKQIQRLQKAQQNICQIEVAEQKDGEKLNVASVGNVVLEGEINILMVKGKTLDGKYGGWENILEAEKQKANTNESDEKEGEEKEAKELTDSKADEAMENDDEEMIDDQLEQDAISQGNENGNGEQAEQQDNETTNFDVNADQDTVEETTENAIIDEEAILKWKELTARLSEVEISIETAVENEEYDEAAELDELLESIKADIEGLGFSEEDLQTAMESMDIPVESNDAQHDNLKGNKEDIADALDEGEEGVSEDVKEADISNDSGETGISNEDAQIVSEDAKEVDK